MWRYLCYYALIPLVWVIAIGTNFLVSKWHEVRRKKLISIISCLVFLMWIIALYDFRPGPPTDALEENAHAYTNHHIPGTQFGGIMWREENSTDLRVSLTNNTDNTYGDVDIVIDPDSWIVGIGQLQAVPKCDITPSTDVQTSLDLAPNGTGKTYSINPAVMASLGDGVRVLCDKIKPHTSIDLIFATTDNPNFPGYYVVKERKPNRGARNPPTEVFAKGTYHLGDQPIKTDKKLKVTMIP